MIISCPACTKPYELENQRIAPLVQIACPSCEDTIILDFEAANNPQLIDPGTPTTLAYLSEADYRQSTTLAPDDDSDHLSAPSSPEVASRPGTGSTKPPLSFHRPSPSPSIPPAQDAFRGSTSSPSPNLSPLSDPSPSPSPTRPFSPAAQETPPPPTQPSALPPPSSSVPSSPAARVPEPTLGDRNFDSVDTGLPPSPSLESFDDNRATPSSANDSSNGRRTMLMTSPMSPGVSKLAGSSHQPTSSGLSGKLPPPIGSQPETPSEEVEEIQELEEFSEIEEEFPAAASFEARDPAASPLANPQPFPGEGHTSLPQPSVGTMGSTSMDSPLLSESSNGLPAPGHPPMNQEHSLGQLGNVDLHANANEQLEASPKQLPTTKSSSTVTTIVLFSLVAIAIAVLALCAFSLLQTGNPNPLPMLQSLGAGN